MFLLPFLIHYLNEQKIKPGKIVITGLLSYCIVIFIYFLVFKFYIAVNQLPQNDRVRINTDILRKLSFLFSDPLPMAFSVNLLYSSRSIFSQIIAPLMMAAWAVSIFIRFKKDKIYESGTRIIIILLFLILIYLPSMLAVENFASYRTLFVFNLAVFYLLIDQLFFFVTKERVKSLATYMICIFLIITGFYNFNFQFVNPLKNGIQCFFRLHEKKYQPRFTNSLFYTGRSIYVFPVFSHPYI